MADPKLVVRGEADFASLNSEVTRTESRFGSLGKNLARGIAVGTAAATYGLVKLGIASSKSASDAQQSFGATESVFGKYADEVIKRSRSAALAVGLSANEYRELSNVTGAMLSSAGTPLRKVAGLTGDLNKRAADMAATFGGPTSQAVEAISSLLRGETDPIERYGVSIKASDISARLAAKGLDELTGKAKKQAEQQERLALLFEQTSSSQGAFRRESSTLANQTQKLDAQWENLKATLGRGVNPALTALARVTSSEILPPIQKLANQYVPKAGREFGKWIESVDFSGMIDDTRELVEGLDWDGFRSDLSQLVDGFRDADSTGSGLADTLEVTGVVFGFLADHSDLLAKSLPYLAAGFVALKAAQVANNTVGRNSLIGFGLQTTAAFAQARANMALAASLRAVNASGSLAATGVAGVTTGVSRMAVVMRGAAGIGGLGLMAHGASQSSKSLGLLESAAGGALTGFSVGGPWGAAIGAGAGALVSLATSTDDTADSMQEARPKIQSMIDTLDQLTGATTAATRAKALDNLQLKDGEGKYQSAIGYADSLGISQRTLVDASLGHAGAVKRVNQAIRQQAFGTHDLVDKNGDVIGSYTGMSASARYLRRSLGLVSTEIRKNKKEARDAAQVTQEWSGKLKGFPRRARTKIDLDGVRPTETAIARLTLKYKNLDRKDIKTILGVTGVDATVKDIKRAADELKRTDRKEARMQARLEGAQKVRSEIGLTHSALANLNGDAAHTWIYTHRVTTYETRGTPPRNPREILPRLFDETDPFEVGRMIADVARQAPKARKAGADVVAKLLEGITGGSDKVKTALDRLTAYIEKRIDLKDAKAERARERAVLKHLRDEYAALIRNGKAQDAINRKLEKAREHLAEVRSWVDQVRQSFVDVGDVTQLGQLEDGTVSGTLLVDQLRDRVAHAERFAELIRQLSDNTGTRLNRTTLQQLLAQGPEAGLATAEALAAGGDAALDEINSLTQQLADTGQGLGAQMSDQFFDLGLNASIGLVEGLESQAAALDEAARRLARRISAAVRRALGGKDGPGRGANGRETARMLGGIELPQIDATTARRRGEAAGVAWLEGFTNPKLGDGGAAGGGGFRVEVKLTAEQTSQLQRGKAVTLDINAAGARGARRRAVTGSR